MNVMLFGKAIAARLLLAAPIAFLLALVIILDDPLYRALAVAGLVVIEIIRDAISMGAVASSSPSRKKTRSARIKVVQN